MECAFAIALVLYVSYVILMNDKLRLRKKPQGQKDNVILTRDRKYLRNSKILTLQKYYQSHFAGRP